MKVYLSFSLFFFVIIINVKAQSLEQEMRECVEVQIEEIKKNTGCKNQNGEITLNVTGRFAPYSFRWTKLSDGSPVLSTGNRVRELRGGFYSVEISSTRVERCRVKKQFFVPGYTFNEVSACNTEVDANQVILRSVNLMQDTYEEGFIVELDYGNSPVTRKMDIIYRTHKSNNYFESSKIWVVVPKPVHADNNPVLYARLRPSFFEKGKTYEFALVYNYDEHLNGCIISNSLQINSQSIPPILPIEIRKTKNDKVFTISPQPAGDVLNIELSPNYNVASIELLTLAGKTLKQFFVEDSTLTQNCDVSNLTSGMYLLKFSTTTHKYFEKIVID